MSKPKIPIITLVGQTNAGKSSLFNLLLKQKRNIVAREAGTTRDTIMAVLELNGRATWLVDTAGLKDPEDDFEATILDQIEEAIASADIICLLIEADQGPYQVERSLVKKILKSQKETILVVNKIDRNLKAQASDFIKFGIKDIFLISTTTKQGLPAFIDHLAERLPDKKAKIEDDILKIALLGRPNVGKSALFNRLGQKQQALVSKRAGTTRDVNRLKVRFEQQTIEFLDTAGLRRPGKVSQGVEKFSMLRTLAAIEESDICLLLIDANEIATNVEQKIAGLVREAAKGLMIIISKWDSLLEKDAFLAAKIAAKLKREFAFIPWAGLVFTSAVTGQNVSKIFELSLAIQQRRQQKIATSKLNNWLQSATLHHPPSGLRNRHPRLNYVVQTDQDPPTFQFFGSPIQYLHASYKRYLERKLREEFDYQGSGLVFIFKDKH